MYPNYLIHYNKNHSKVNGQFVSGDGDGDGQVNDHAQRSKGKQKKRIFSNTAKGKALKRGVIATAAVGGALVALNVGEYFVTKKLKNAAYDSIFKNATGNANGYGSSSRSNQFVDDIKRASVAKVIGGDW